MFNGSIIRQLIAKAGLTNKEFQKQMFGNKSTDIYHLENAKNLRSDTLERLRDVLKCSMDDFFTPPSWASTTLDNGVGNGLQQTKGGATSMETQYLRDLIEEKDKRINILESYIKLLETNERK